MFRLLLPLCLLVGTVCAAAEPSAIPAEFVTRYCTDCHGEYLQEGHLRLDTFDWSATDPKARTHLTRIHDRIAKGEMPPADADQPTAAERTVMTSTLGRHLTEFERTRNQTEGRTVLRRLNRAEYEYTLRDLLHLPELQVREMLPPDPEAHGFDNVADALTISYVQLNKFLEAADKALNQATVLHPRPKTETQIIRAKNEGRFAGQVKRGKEAVLIGDAVGVLRQPNSAQTPWKINRFKPSYAGEYRMTLRCFGFRWDRGEVKPAERDHLVSVYALGDRTSRLLGTFDTSSDPNAPSEIEFTGYFEPGERLKIHIHSLDDRNFGNKNLAEYTGPGFAWETITAEGPLIDQWPPASHAALYGDLPIVEWTADSGVTEPNNPPPIGWTKRKGPQYHVHSDDPLDDGRRLLAQFCERAFRRPVTEADVEPYWGLIAPALRSGRPFHEAMQIGYRAVLCSPDLVFFDETPGELTDHALASRLSYFLWRSLPDEELRAIADDPNRSLSDPETMREQTNRLLDDPRSDRFIREFSDRWLELGRIDITQPDSVLYPEFDLHLQESMIAETRAFLRSMIDDNLSIDHVVDSNFLMVNSRLAEHYGLDPVEGVELRPVPIPEDSPRGGLLTQASVLKVTANGTTTSPVTRGTWVLDRLLGTPAPEPPPMIEGIDPDVRGATTIREQLQKHRDNVGCASCHRTIDPPGFALESFDVIGGYRDRYRSLEKGEKPDRKLLGRPVRYRLGLPVDSSGQSADGQPFADVTEFRDILLSDREQLARNLLGRLTVYATGAGVGFSDRAVIDQMLAKIADDDYGFRSAIHAVTGSRLFREK